MGVVPPGGVLPIPMHSSPAMNYNDNESKVAYAQQPQSSFSPQRHGICSKNSV